MTLHPLPFELEWMASLVTARLEAAEREHTAAVGANVASRTDEDPPSLVLTGTR